MLYVFMCLFTLFVYISVINLSFHDVFNKCLDKYTPLEEYLDGFGLINGRRFVSSICYTIRSTSSLASLAY